MLAVHGRVVLVVLAAAVQVVLLELEVMGRQTLAVAAVHPVVQPIHSIMPVPVVPVS
jgi:hypothetical protein